MTVYTKYNPQFTSLMQGHCWADRF